MGKSQYDLDQECDRELKRLAREFKARRSEARSDAERYALDVAISGVEMAGIVRKNAELFERKT